MDAFFRWAAATKVVVVVVCFAGGASAASWDVEVEMRFGDSGVMYAAEVGFPLLAKFIEMELREEERVHEDEVNAIRDAVSARLGALSRFTINGAESAPELARFGIAGQKSADGSYARQEAIARLQVIHASPAPPLQSVVFDWGLLPERYFESAAVDDLVKMLEPRDRSAIIRLRIGNEPPVELEMRAGQTDFAWERGGEDFGEAVEAGEDGPGRGRERERLILLIAIAVLIVLRVAWKEYGEWSRRRRD